MKKIMKIENIDCANCAAKIEDGIKKIDGVNSCTLSFFAEKLVIDADDDKFDAVMKEADKVAHKVEPDCEISF